MTRRIFSAKDSLESFDFTPEVADASSGGNVASIGTVAAANISRAGDMVTVQLDLRDINTTGLAAGNVLYLRNIPFTPDNGLAQGAIKLGVTTTSGSLSLQQVAGQYAASIQETVSGGNSASIIVSDLTSGAADIFCNITFRANSDNF